MNAQFERTPTSLTLRVAVALTVLGTVLGMAPAQQAPSQTPAAKALVFVPYVREMSCPKDIHASNGCIVVTGKNFDKRAFWIQFRRTAFLGVAGTGVPAGCMAVTTAGSLMSAQGELHFKGTGYYCPNAAAAVYHCSFDEAEAQKFGMPVDITINHDGRKESETFTLGH
jgi:hypothetical protein